MRLNQLLPSVTRMAASTLRYVFLLVAVLNAVLLRYR